MSIPKGTFILFFALHFISRCLTKSVTADPRFVHLASQLGTFQSQG